MKSFNLDRVEERTQERSVERQTAEAEAAERQAFNDEVDSLLRDFPDIADGLRFFSHLAIETDSLDPDGVAEARAAVRSRLQSAAEAYGEICEQASERGSLSSLGARAGDATRRWMHAASKPEPDFSSVNKVRAYYQQVFADKGFLESPEQQADFDEQWSYIFGARDFIEESSSELRRVSASANDSPGSYW